MQNTLALKKRAVSFKLQTSYLFRLSTSAISEGLLGALRAFLSFQGASESSGPSERTSRPGANLGSLGSLSSTHYLLSPLGQTY